MNKTLSIPILFLATFLFVVYFLLPEYREMAGLNKDVVEKNAEFQKFKSYVSGLYEAKETVVQKGAALDKVNAGLPDEFSVASIFNFFQLKAEENGLIVKSLNKSEPIKPSSKESEQAASQTGVKENYFSVELEGPVSAFENFLRGLEKSSRMIEVEELSMQKEEKDLFKFNVLAKVYSY